MRSVQHSATVEPPGDRSVAPLPTRSWREVAVVIPCHNEESSIARVVGDFRYALPGARIVVVDNASTDATAARAVESGAEVVRESRRGKGHALLRGFAAIRDVRYVIMVDGDDTYPADEAPRLVGALLAGADVAIGTRLASHEAGAYRAGHTFGNHMFSLLVRTLFGARTQDLLSGYRAFDQRFLSVAPLIAQGFEVETELTLQALVGGYHVVEVPIHYRARRAGSVSKLSTYRDGYRILLALLAFFRDYRPLTCFGLAGLVLFASSGVAGGIVIAEYLRTGQVLRMPTAVLAVGLGLLGAVSVIGGLLLSSVSRRSQELAALLTRR